MDISLIDSNIHACEFCEVNNVEESMEKIDDEFYCEDCARLCLLNVVHGATSGLQLRLKFQMVQQKKALEDGAVRYSSEMGQTMLKQVLADIYELHSHIDHLKSITK